MKLILLCAGRGSRLGPLTDELPKCLTKYRGIPLLEWILRCTKDFDEIGKKVVIGGYRHELLDDIVDEWGLNKVVNAQYAETNMVSSLFCAEAEFDDDLLISYSDIIYHPEIVSRMIAARGPVSVAVDSNWQKLWGDRQENLLDDAETMIIDEQGHIRELGKKPEDISQVQGQYMGIIRFSREVVAEIRDFYHDLDPALIYDGKDYKNMYMTSFLQLLIDNGYPVKAILNQEEWIEVDTQNDIEIYEEKGYMKELHERLFDEGAI